MLFALLSASLKKSGIRPMQGVALALATLNILMLLLCLLLCLSGVSSSWDLPSRLRAPDAIDLLNESIDRLILFYRLYGVSCVGCMVLMIANVIVLRSQADKGTPARRLANNQIILIILGLFYIPAYAMSWRSLLSMRFSAPPESYIAQVELFVWGEYAYLLFLFLSCFFLLLGVKHLWHIRQESRVDQQR